MAQNNLNIRRGDIYYIEKFPTFGSEQQSGRPAIIVSNNFQNRYSHTVQVVYLTTQPKADNPTHVVISSIDRESTALCEQITTIDIDRLKSYKCSCTDEEMAEIDNGLLCSLGIDMADNVASSEYNRMKMQCMESETSARIYKQFYTDLVSAGRHPAELLQEKIS